MTATSFVWIAPAIRSGAVKLRALRAAGFLPVAVDSVDGAVGVLRQFRAAAVVLHVREARGWEDCARLLATGSPVAVLLDAVHPDVTQRYLSAGCAAVIDAGCPPDQLIAALTRVAAGDLGVLCPKSSCMTTGSAGAALMNTERSEGNSDALVGRRRAG